MSDFSPAIVVLGSPTIHLLLVFLLCSDYAISQFRFLERLLLVHGRWNYHRISMVILYSFYKNILLMFTLFYFGFENTFTGTTLYESYLGTSWNVLFTLVPIIAYGVTEQDLSAETVLQNPSVYWNGQKRLGFNGFKMLLWVLTAIFHSCVAYFMTQSVLASAVHGGILSSDATTTDSLFVNGSITNFVCVLIVNYKLALHTNYWTKFTWIFLALSIAVWLLFVGCYSYIVRFLFNYVLCSFRGVCYHTRFSSLVATACPVALPESFHLSYRCVIAYRWHGVSAIHRPCLCLEVAVISVSSVSSLLFTMPPVPT